MKNYRLALLADIHGNRPAYRAVIAHLQSERPDALVIAGDTVGGPHDEEILANLIQSSASYAVYIVRGNAEDYVARMDDGSAPPEWRSAQQFTMLRWMHQRLSAPVRNRLLALPARLSIELPGASSLTVFHGTPGSRTSHLLPAVDPLALPLAFSTTSEAVLVCGHSHEPWVVRNNERMALNPGAVCSPLDGQTGAQYAMLEWDGQAWQVDFRCIPYDLNEIARDMQQSGQLATGYLARAHLASIQHGGDWGKQLVAHGMKLAEQSGCQLLYVPVALWEQAGRTFFKGKSNGRFSS